MIVAAAAAEAEGTYRLLEDGKLLRGAIIDQRTEKGGGADVNEQDPKKAEMQLLAGEHIG